MLSLWLNKTLLVLVVVVVVATRCDGRLKQQDSHRGSRQEAPGKKALTLPPVANVTQLFSHYQFARQYLNPQEELIVPCVRIPTVAVVPAASAIKFGLGHDAIVVVAVECRFFLGDGCRPSDPMPPFSIPGTDTDIDTDNDSRRNRLKQRQQQQQQSFPLSENGNFRWICLRRSLDNGLTWKEDVKFNVSQMKAMDPSLIWDAVRQQLLLTFAATEPRGIYTLFSRDGGVTWSAPRPVLDSRTNNTAWSSFGSPGNAVVLVDNGPRRGRLVGVGYSYDETVCLGQRTCGQIWWSDDGGAKWQFSPQRLPWVVEPQILQSPVLPGSDPATSDLLVQFSRSDVSSDNIFVTSSTDGGDSWSTPIPHAMLNYSVSQPSALRIGSILYVASPQVKSL